MTEIVLKRNFEMQFSDLEISELFVSDCGNVWLKTAKCSHESNASLVFGKSRESRICFHSRAPVRRIERLVEADNCPVEGTTKIVVSCTVKSYGNRYCKLHIPKSAHPFVDVPCMLTVTRRGDNAESEARADAEAVARELGWILKWEN